MKIETYLNALTLTETRLVLCRFGNNDSKWNKLWSARKLERQAHAFRARILRTFSVSKSINEDLLTEIDMLYARITELEDELYTGVDDED